MKFSISNSIDKGALDLRIVRLCYQYATLKYWQSKGEVLSRTDKEKMRSLELFLSGDVEDDRRSHRRISTMLPATLSRGDALEEGIMLNISGSGMFILTELNAALEDDVCVCLPLPENKRYSFTCRVKRKLETPCNLGLGLLFSSPPAFEEEN